MHYNRDGTPVEVIQSESPKVGKIIPPQGGFGTCQPKVDYDGLTEHPMPERVKVGLKNQFTHKSMTVEEWVIATSNPQVMKLCWVRSPLENLVVEGFANMIVHSNFLNGDDDHMEMVRGKVRLKFDEYWASPKPYK